MKVPFLELLPTYKELQPELDAAYHRVMESGWYLLGEELESFESEFAKYCNVKYCVGCGNGLDALQLILRAFDIGPGDEVIVPAQTFIATWLAVSNIGAVPVAVDIEPNHYNIDPEKIEAAITDKTKAIIPVHLYGHPAEMNPIKKIAMKYGLRVIEDAAQAHGATYHGQLCGSLGDAAAFSFYPGKNLGAFADAGAVVTDNQVVAEKVRKLSNYGSSVKYQHDMKGVNSRMDELTAAFLRVKLGRLDDWNMRRRQVASTYISELSGLNHLILPQEADGAISSWHLFPISCSQRDRVLQCLRDAGVAAQIHYPVLPLQSEAYISHARTHKNFPIAKKAADQEISLPMGPHLSLESVKYVCNVLSGL